MNPETPDPRGFHGPHNGLSAAVDVDMLDGDLLLPFAAVTIERFEESCLGARKLIGLIEIFAPAFKRLITSKRSSSTGATSMAFSK